jgi:SEC-C motif domain protein
MRTAPSTAACPCGGLGADRRPLAFPACCGRYLDDFPNTTAPDAESLMRSRYTAFVCERADYLLATWHVSRRPGRIEFEPAMKWLGLAVTSHRQADAGHAEVEFIARQKPAAARAVRLHERSRFVREDGRWYYVDGDLFQART